MNIDLEQRSARIGVRELIGPEATRWDVPWLPKRGQLGTALHSERRRLRSRPKKGILVSTLLSGSCCIGTIG